MDFTRESLAKISLITLRLKDVKTEFLDVERLLLKKLQTKIPNCSKEC